MVLELRKLLMETVAANVVVAVSVVADSVAAVADAKAEVTVAAEEAAVAIEEAAVVAADAKAEAAAVVSEISLEEAVKIVAETLVVLVVQADAKAEAVLAAATEDVDLNPISYKKAGFHMETGFFSINRFLHLHPYPI